VSENELGMFLRQRREALTPAEAGLPGGSRRRTSGLRRAEVAMLAGVSVEYLTRLEQGRDRRPSAPILSAIAETLQLSISERTRLYYLAKGADTGFNCKGQIPPGHTVRPAVQAILDRLDPAPAILLNRLTDILACTDGYQRLAAPAGLLHGNPPNLARYVFTDPRARSVFPDWDHVADEQVATLKRGPFRADRHVAAIADELTVSAGAEFEPRVATIPGLPKHNGVLRLTHPEAGELRLSYETLDLIDDDQRLIVYVPADSATSAALDRLTIPRPRLVSG
jgi:transcriptional regulator with XRE-family HTH domain